MLPSTTSITGFSTRLTQRSEPKVFYVSARNVAANPVLVSVTTGYEISLNPANNYGNGLSLANVVGGVLAPTAVYVRLIGSAAGR